MFDIISFTMSGILPALAEIAAGSLCAERCNNLLIGSDFAKKTIFPLALDLHTYIFDEKIRFSVYYSQLL
jgi:hypothetical protein